MTFLPFHLINKCKTKSEKRTRSGRVVVPDYRGLLTGTDVGTSSKKTTYTDENPSQENEETEDSFENRFQGNHEKRSIQDDIVSNYPIMHFKNNRCLTL